MSNGLIARLANARVDFVVEGELASWVHGRTAITRVIELVFRMDPDNLLRLFDALKDLHPTHRMTPEKLPFTREQAERVVLKNLYLSTDMGRLDCLGEIKGLGGFSECLAQSQVIDVEGARIHVLTLDALITAKRAMGRPRDLHAVLELEAIREKLRNRE